MSDRLPAPRPHYFISRTNGTLVPLIPADELPFNVRLRSVRRVLQLDQTCGMQHVGTAPYTGLVYRLEDDPDLYRSTCRPAAASESRGETTTPASHTFVPDIVDRLSLAQSPARNNQAFVPQHPCSANAAVEYWRKLPKLNLIDKSQSVIDTIVGSSPMSAEEVRTKYLSKCSARPPSSNTPFQDKKEYCTYWIRTGECDYMQQGCLYKHEMPDTAILEKIGFRGVPRWWAEKNRTMKLGAIAGRRMHSVEPIINSAALLDSKTEKTENTCEKPAHDDEGSSLESQDGSPLPFRSAKAMEESLSNNGMSVTFDKSNVAAAAKEHVSKNKAPQQAVHNIHKASTAGDLIDFSPRLSSSSSSGESPTTVDSTGFSSTQCQPLGLTAPAPSTPKDIEDPVTHVATEIFMPHDEPAKQEIAEVTKRHARRRAPKSRMKDGRPNDKQIRNLRKCKHDRGLMTSKPTFLSAGDERDSPEHIKTGRGRLPWHIV